MKEPTTMVKWIRLNKWCEITGETPDMIHARRRKGQWLDGVHCVVGPDKNLRINPVEADKWAESQLQTPSPVE